MSIRYKTRYLVAILTGLLAMAAWAPAAEVKIALDCPPDIERCGTYVWSHAFGEYLTAHGMKVKEYPTEALGGEDEKLDQISQGLLEVSNSLLAKVGQLEPAANGFWLPYLWDSYDHLDRVLEKSDLLRALNAQTGKKGVRILALLPVGGFIGIHNTKKPIQVPEDLKGLRMRATDKIQSKYLEAWGASSVIVPWPEIYNALQTGVADGYMNPAIVPVLFKHTEILKHFSDVRAIASVRVAIASEQWYSGLSQKDRTLVDEAVGEANRVNRAWLDRTTQKSMDELKAAGMTVTLLTPDQRERFAALVRPLYSEVVNEDAVKRFMKAAADYR